MMHTINKRLFYILCFVLAIGFLAGCDKDEDVTSDKTELLSFGPTGAQHGDTLRFIGNNLNKVTAIELTGASVAQADFVSQTAELITIIVPEATERGFVTLKTPDGDIVSKTQLDLGVAITVSSMTRQARPGENITITGNYLNWVTSVTFADDKATDVFVSKTMTELVVTVPEDAQTGPLVLSYGGTEPMGLETEDTLQVTLPVATAMAPNGVKHKTNLTITGTDLDLAAKVMFAGVDTAVTAFISQSATQLVVQVPADATTGPITLMPASGVASVSAQNLTVLMPAVTLMTPNPIDPATDLTITGTNLDLVSGITFTGIPAPVTTFVSQSATRLVVQVPTGTLKGKLILSVLNSVLTVETESVLDIKGGLPPLADFPFAIYTDAFENGFQDYSWAVRNIASTANVRQGNTSIKATYGSGGYEGITFHAGTPVATGNYTKLEFSIFGEAGTDGKKMNIVINGGWSNPPQVTIKEGEWSTYSLTLSSLGNPNPLSEIVLQSAGWSGVVHIDHVGLR